MIRIVTELIPIPSLLILCDHHHCGSFSQFNFERAPTKEQISAAMKPFLASLGLHGWWTGVDLQFCPGHSPAKVSKLTIPDMLIRKQ